MAPPSLRFIALSDIHPDPGNPREDETPTADMVESVRELGILQALLVKTDGDGYVLIDGHRRWRSGMQVDPTGFGEVPCVIVDGWSAAQVLEAQIATGIHAKGLNPIEQAKALERLQKATGTTQRAAASIAGLSQAKVSQLLMLLRLAPHLQAKVARGEMGVSTALGYNRAPSRQIATRGHIDPGYDALRDAVKRLGMGLMRDDDVVIAEAATAAATELARWMPDGGPTDEGRKATMRCHYCPKELPVDHPAGATERIRAQSAHLLVSEKCKLRHQRALRRG